MKLFLLLLAHLCLGLEVNSADPKWGTFKPNLYFAVTQRPTLKEYED
jgi:hypothetical protein